MWVCSNIASRMQEQRRTRQEIECVWNVMAHTQKPDFVFRRNGRVHLNRRGRQFSRLLAAEVCASAVVMLDTPRSEVVWKYLLPAPLASFPFSSPPVRHRVPSGFKSTVRGSKQSLLNYCHCVQQLKTLPKHSMVKECPVLI